MSQATGPQTEISEIAAPTQSLDRAPEVVSATEPDWSREHFTHGWEPSRQLLRTIRRYQHYQSRTGIAAWLGMKWNVLKHRFWSAVTGADIPLNVSIGGGLLLPHPNGVVIHPDVKIGPNCLIFQQVTLGSNGSSGTPMVGGHVDIGAGAKVIGAITLGDHCRVGANAVVTRDVLPGTTVAGIPARVIVERAPSVLKEAEENGRNR